MGEEWFPLHQAVGTIRLSSWLGLGTVPDTWEIPCDNEQEVISSCVHLSAPWQIVHKEQKLVFEGLKNIQLQGCTVLSLSPLWLSLPGKAIKLFFSTSPQKNKNNKQTNKKYKFPIPV